MSKVLEDWTVLPHGRLHEIDAGILSVTGRIDMPMGRLERRMTVVRLRDGRLVIYSAIALDEPQMKALEAFGAPAFLVVPGDHHRHDAGIWKDRYPALHVVAPDGAMKAASQAVHVDAGSADFGDPDVTFLTVPGTGGHEAALCVRRPSGTTLILNDLIGNLDKEPGFSNLILRLFGFAGDEPHVPMPVKPHGDDNRAAVAAQLRAWADDPTLKRIIVSHGDPIDADPGGVLRRLADSLT